MAVSELDSFLGKFKQLCLAGISATLNVDCQHGKTLIDLKAELTFKPAQNFVNEKPRNPAYYRRKSRRLTSRLTDGFKSNEAEIVSSGDEKVDVTKEEDDKVDVIKVDAKATEVEKVDTLLLMKDDCQDNLVTPSNVNGNKNVSNELSTEDLCDTLSIDNQIITSENCESSVKVGSESLEKDDMVKEYMSESDIVCVHAIASLQNSSHNIVDDVTLGSILEIVSNKEHLRRNIHEVNVGNIRNRQMYRSTKFEHEVELSVQVKKNDLWESARSYLWKNLGTSIWTLHDGTQVSFRRSHQK